MGDIPLGRIAGIKVGFSWTVLLVAGLYTVVLADNRFPIEQPGLSSVDYWVAGVLGALLFFASLLAHELGHALVARREGVGVSGISLWLLGGMAKLESEPATAGAELRIAAVGPFTSAACGLLFLAAGFVLDGAGLVGLAGTVFGWLGFINLLLAAFNMIPASPLDGGKVLGALLWMRSGDQVGSSLIAARVGQVIGAGMVVLGFIELNRNGDYGIGLLLVGFFIVSNATAQLRAAPVRAALDGVRVADVMAADPPMAADWMTIDAFLRDLAANPLTGNHQAYPVQQPDGRITGLLTADSIRSVPTEHWTGLRVSELAFPIDRLGVIGADDDVLSALQHAGSAATRDLLVVNDEGRVVGVMDPSAVEDIVRDRAAAGR